jgi:hypothetical protein
MARKPWWGADVPVSRLGGKARPVHMAIWRTIVRSDMATMSLSQECDESLFCQINSLGAAIKNEYLRGT